MEITLWLLNVKASAWEDNQVKWMLQDYYLAQEPIQQFSSEGRDHSVLGGADPYARNRLLHVRACRGCGDSLCNDLCILLIAYLIKEDLLCEKKKKQKKLKLSVG